MSLRADSHQATAGLLDLSFDEASLLNAVRAGHESACADFVRRYGG